MDVIQVGMLKRRAPPRRRSNQQGIVLLVALVVLVAMMVAGIAMMRSVDSANLVAGNLAFQQAATNAADQGIEKAITMLQGRSATQLSADDSSNGYFATMTSSQSPGAGVTWQSFWEANLKAAAVDAGTDQAGNHIYYVVHRECQSNGLPGSGAQCVASPVVTTSTGNSEEAGELELSSASQIYYRITVRVSGPRRTESYVQSHIAL